ncbi:MAG: IPT/TIG domain-containing protein [Cyanobacteria bacterium P01_A01_bin.68]
MKTTFKLFGLIFMLFAFIACSDDDDGDSAPAEFTVTAISPESGTVGTEITITGTDFPTDASLINLTFGGVAATINSLSSTQITTTVPAGATSGNVSIRANGVTKTTPVAFSVLVELISGTMENLFAPSTSNFGEPAAGEFTKFSFATGDVTTSDTEWDLAFRTTTIAVNGGVITGTNDEPERNGNGEAAIFEGLFSEVTSTSINGLTFAQDGTGAFAIPTGSNNGWYNYNPMTNVISPLPGKILVFRTHDGKVAKVEVLSYYEDAPASPDGFADTPRYYTFNYVYNPNEGETSLAN